MEKSLPEVHRNTGYTGHTHDAQDTPGDTEDIQDTHRTRRTGVRQDTPMTGQTGVAYGHMVCVCVGGVMWSLRSFIVIAVVPFGIAHTPPPSSPLFYNSPLYCSYTLPEPRAFSQVRMSDLLVMRALMVHLRVTVERN